MSVTPAKRSGGKREYNKNQVKKRQRVWNARTIRAEAAISSAKDSANAPGDLSESGAMLNVNQFVNTRQYEIKQLQVAMHKSKASGATRVFQALPRKLRRRTASHNIRRIPKRMRNRALREMLKSDQKNTVAKSTTKRHGLNAKGFYKAKMAIKLLRLASRSTTMKLNFPEGVSLANCKVRGKIRSLQKIIKDARAKRIPDEQLLNNKVGSIDVSAVNKVSPKPRGRLKYMKRQSEFCWLPSHVWNAKRSHMIKRWGYQIPWSATQKCFKLVHRIGGSGAASDGTLSLDSSFIGTIILSSKQEEEQLLSDLIKALTNGRAIRHKYKQKRTAFQGLCFDINTEDLGVIGDVLGMIEVIWINNANAMLRLHPAIYPKILDKLLFYSDRLSVQDARYAIASITLSGAETLKTLTSILRSTETSTSYQQLTNVCHVTDVSALPSDLSFAFNAMDPRHLSSPKQLNVSRNKLDTKLVLDQHNRKPADDIERVLLQLVTQSGRTDSYKNQQTTHDITIRRKQLKFSGSPISDNGVLPFNKGKDPEIPLFIYWRKESNDWVMLMPWFWHLHFWNQIQRCPRVFNIGLRQTQQLQYERKELYFPDDFPFTETGYLENTVYKMESAKIKWERKPISKRVNFSKLKDVHNVSLPSFSGEIGNYFSCDWRLLQILRNGISFLIKDGKKLEYIDHDRTTQFLENGERRITVLNDLFELYKDFLSKDIDLKHSKLPVALDTAGYNEVRPQESIQNQMDILNKPLFIRAVSCRYNDGGHVKDNARIYRLPLKSVENGNVDEANVFRANGKLQRNISKIIPGPEDLIGFVTSGSYNLQSGSSVGNGFVMDDGNAHLRSHQEVLIRNVGSNDYRTAIMSHIDI
ncbi:ribonuclease P/MRP protein subunit [Maudiozyma humilis]|uniref:Ribonuclease P/MRP protein subunit n=1 Tax=Maudiozyma humilis TaxID=51915 RepID=A0AAV5S5F5_MAUHU|nr:ribonuclease P/MRP protein subunit [Kazachstania humilis]